MISSAAPSTRASSRGRAALAALGLALGVVASPRPAGADDTVDYVVRPGDTCIRIARRELGDGRRYRDIHRLNPGMGTLPHRLEPGSILRLPASGRPAGVRAGTVRTGGVRLTAARGEVRIADPDQPHQPPVDATADQLLANGLRLMTGTDSIAVVVVGPGRTITVRDRSQVVAGASPHLDDGMVRTSVSRRTRPIRIETADGSAVLGPGAAVVAVHAGEGTTVANVGHATAALRGKTGRAMPIPHGMGSRVLAGRRPQRPRKLPAAPSWVAEPPSAFPAPPDGATVPLDWQPVDGAGWYRVSLALTSDEIVAATEVPATTTHVELAGVPPGRYLARVATVDLDRFEGLPSDALAVDVVAVPLTTPGTRPGRAMSPLPAGATLSFHRVPERPTMAQGAAVGDRDLACAEGERSGAPLALAAPGVVSIACTTLDGVALDRFEVEVVPLEARVAGGDLVLRPGESREVTVEFRSTGQLGTNWRLEPGPGLTVEAVTSTQGLVVGTVAADRHRRRATELMLVDDATGWAVARLPVAIDAPPAAPVGPALPIDGRVEPGRSGSHVTGGAYVGWTALPRGAGGFELGDAPLYDYQVDSGPGLGLRLGWWPRSRVGAEVEAGLWPLDFVGVADRAWVVTGHAHLVVTLAERGRLAARALAGGGAYLLRTSADYARDDVDLDADYGLTGVWRAGRSLRVRVDGRHHLAPDRGTGVAHLFEVTLGVETTLGR